MMKPLIGIDLGGSKVAAALVTEQGAILHRLSEPTVLDGRDELLTQLTRVIEELSDASGVAGVGIGTPGFVDSKEGQVLLATNLPGWTGVELKRELRERLGNLPVEVENDANVAALGEAWLGAGRDLSSFLMLTLGTGVGGAIFSSGLWAGAHYRAGEFGHAILYPDGTSCGCGRRGCVEQYLSGRAVARAYYGQMHQEATAERVILLASQGDELAIQVTHKFARDLAVLIASLQNILDPSAFILSGGLIEGRSVWWHSLERELNVHGASPALVVPATLGNDAGVLGAAWLARGAYCASNS